ncbi:hypothetical protein BsWGS_06642 [Bradybaena similaris]
MTDQNGFQGNLTSVWGIIKGHIDTMVDRAVGGTHLLVAGNNTGVGRFKLRLKSYLQDPLSHVNLGRQSDLRYSVHQEIKGAMEKAVDSAMSEINKTLISPSEKEDFVEAMDSDIEYDLYKAVHRNASQQESSGFFESLSVKDETVFVALVSMGVIIPIIFFTLLIIFFYKRHREAKKRSREMLLRDQPDLCMDEYSGDDKGGFDDSIPDLDLKHLRM